MDDARLFRMFGFFVEREFLQRDECARIRSAMDGADAEAAGVVHEGDIILDRELRSTARLEVDDAWRGLIDARLAPMRARLEQHFRATLEGWQEPQFLRYAAGDFFRVHADTSDVDHAPDFLRERKISTVVFLGHPGDGDGSGAGGDLVFYELIDDPRMHDRGFAFPHDEGTLLAFPSTVPHEVTTVTSGRRYSVATWFY